MIRVTRSINNKVTIELTTEELSAVENDLEVYIAESDDTPSHATELLKLRIEQYWLGLEPRADD